MALHPDKEEALLVWINGLELGEPVHRISHLQDGDLLLNLVYKLKEEEPSQAPVHLPRAEKLSIISDFLYNVCHVKETVLLTLAKGKMLELELTKVVLLLCHYAFVNGSLVSEMGVETQWQLASMLRYVHEGENGLYLREGLDKLLATSSAFHNPSVSSTSSHSEDCSPLFFRPHRSPLVNFVELNTVASSSFTGSPLQELMSTPKVQVKRLREELAREGDVRDELERKLTERITLLSEKEGQISQLQHRLQRLQRDQEEMEKEHNATLTELQQKNDGLLTRVHEVLKQCRDLKTDNGQKERRIDELMEENGTLAAQVRNSFTQLATAEEEVAKLTEAHNSSQTEWGNRRDLLQRELSQALTDRESLTEQIQILQGKISVLEDELNKLSQQHQEKGEVLGPIVEREKLKQELAGLTVKLSQLEETIYLLEKEKKDIETLLAEERRSFEKETLHLGGQISDLQQSIINIQAEKEACEQASRAKQENLTLQIAALETDLAHFQQLEVQLTAEIVASAEAREGLALQLKDLKEVLSIERQSFATLEINLRDSKAAHDLQEQTLRLEVTQLQQEIGGHLKKLEEALNEINSLRGEMSWQRDVALQKEQEVSALAAQNKSQAEDFAHLQNQLAEATALATDKQSELLKLQNEVQHQENLRAKSQEFEETRRKELQREVVELQSRVQELTSLASEREVQLGSLHKKMTDQEVYNQELLQKSEDALQKELKNVMDLKRQMESAECKAAVKRELLESTEEKLKQMELMYQQKEMLASEVCKAKETLERTVTAQMQDLDRYQQDLETLNKEKEHLTLLNKSLQSECQTFQTQSKEQEQILNALKADLQSAQGRYERDLEALKKEKEHIQDECQTLQTENKGQQEALEDLKADLQKTHDGYQKDLEIMKKENTHLSSAKRSFQIECQNMQAEKKSQYEAISTLKADLQDRQDEYQQRVETLKEEQDGLSSENHSLKSKCQNLQAENKNQQDMLNALKVDLQNAEDGYQQELGILRKEKDLLTSASQSFESRCQSLLAENMVQLEELNVLKADLENTQNEYQQEIEKLKNEKEQISSMNQSLQSECQSLQAEKTGHKEELNALKADLLESKNKYEKSLEMSKNEKDQLSSATQFLQNECQTLQMMNKQQLETVNTLKADLQNAQDGYRQELEALKKEQEHLSSVNQSLQTKWQNLQEQKTVQQEELNALKAGMQENKDKHERDLVALKSEKEQLASVNQSLQSKCQNLQTEHMVQQEEINALKADAQENEDKHERDLVALKSEKEQLASVNQNLQTEHMVQQEEINALKADAQDNKDKHERDLVALKSEKEQLASVNQNLQTENMVQQEEINALKADAQENKDKHERDLVALKSEKEQLASVNQSLQSKCQNLQTENMVQQEEINALKAYVQENKDKHERDLVALKSEKEQLASVNQNLQTENMVQQEEVNALKADAQENRDKHERDLVTLKSEKEQLASVNQSLQNKCQNLQTENMVQQEEINALKADAQENKDKYHKDLESLKNEKEHLTSVNQSLLGDLEAAQKVGAELVSAQKHENELEIQVKELEVKIIEFSTLADVKEAEIRNLHLEIKQQEASRLSEKALRAELETKVSQLQVQVDEASKLASERESELRLLQDQFDESEKQRRDAHKAEEVLEKAVSELRLKQKQELEEYHQQLEALVTEKDLLTSENQTLLAESKAKQETLNDLQSSLQQEVKSLKRDKEHLSSVNQSLQRECDASQRLGAELESKLKGQTKSILAMEATIQQKEKQNQDLQEQLKVKNEAVEHYKVQVEKAKTHYNGKKQLLLEEQEARQTLQATLENSEREAKALKAELKLVSMELEKIKTSEKNLMLKVNSLETQLDYAARQLRDQRKQEDQSVQVKHRESLYVKIPENTQNLSKDSLDHDLDDSLNAVGKHVAFGESSTPLGRSSERLAEKRRAQDMGSLETLYFTPMMPRGKKRDYDFQEQKLEGSITSFGQLALDSAKKQSNSVQRRRTTQVINITMSKKTPLAGSEDAEESFFSLHSTQSQPNLATHKSRPISGEIFDSANTLLNLPGYRPSSAHNKLPPRAVSTLCVGAEDEPDQMNENWLRLAELQSRNRACLPHLKSSYPLESRPSLGFSHLPVSDEEVRTGDPTETIRRASVLPSQIKDSIGNHRLSLAPPAAAPHVTGRGHHAPQVSKAREVRSMRNPLASKRPAEQIQELDTPEAKKMVSCFPRTPKGRNLRSSSSQNIAPSPAARRQSMAFVIENTPKRAARVDSRLQRGINKLRKSPHTGSTKSPKITSSAKKLMKFRMKK